VGDGSPVIVALFVEQPVTELIQRVVAKERDFSAITALGTVGSVRCRLARVAHVHGTGTVDLVLVAIISAETLIFICCT